MMTYEQLQSASYTFDQPFMLALAEGDILYAHKIVRIIPGRRLVAFGLWRDKPVVAKLFFDSKRARHHIDQEQAGIKVLRENNIPTPLLHYVGENRDQTIRVLLFEQISEAQTLEEYWRNKISVTSAMPMLKNVVTELATQHVLGIVQQDLHLKNFLIAEKTIYTLDAAQINHSAQLIDKKTSIDNLALFLSQLGVGIEKYQEELFLHYAKARAWLIKLEDTKELLSLIKRYHQSRWQQYQKKIFRDCSHFASLHDWRRFGMYDRADRGAEFAEFLQQPEFAFNHATTKMLKAGRSSTVVQVTLDRKTYVIKRYNIKNFWHRLRRMLRPTRAVKSWRFAQKLRLFYLGTPRPVAFIEQRWLGLRGTSYFAMEQVDGISADRWFAERATEVQALERMVNRLLAILFNLARLDITHGDLKLTNILINQQEQPMLIDFDGATEHKTLTSLRASWDKEVARFLENFQHAGMLFEIFKSKLIN